MENKAREEDLEQLMGEIARRLYGTIRRALSSCHI